MATDAELKILVTAVLDEFRRGMAEVQQTVRAATAQASSDFKRAEADIGGALRNIQGELGASVEGMRTSFDRIKHVAEATFAVLVGGGAFREVIAATQAWAFEAQHLSHVLGVTTEQASVFAVAAREAGVPMGEVTAAIRGLRSAVEALQHIAAHPVTT